MLATRGPGAPGRRRGRAAHRVAAAIAAAAVLVGLAAAPASATPTAPTASVADGVRVAVIVPITAPAQETGLIPAELLEEFTGPTGLLSRQLDAIDGTAATLAVDPMILASIRVLGTAAPSSARAWLARLDALPNDRFALPYGDADPTLFTQSEAATAPRPLGFSFAIDPANFAAAAPTPTSAPTTVPSPTPTPTPTSTSTSTVDPDAPVAVPTDEQVVALDGAIEGLVWPRAGTVAESDPAALGATALVLSAADVAGAASGLATVGGLRTLVVDPELSAAVEAAAAAFDDTAWSEAVASASAQLVAALGEQSAATGTLIVALDRRAAGNAARLPATIAALTADPAVTAVGASALLGIGDAAEAALVPGAQDPARISGIDARMRAEGDADAFATAAVEPARIIEPARLTTLVIGSQAWVDRADWSTVLDTADAEVDALLASVHVIESSFQFIADRSNLPVAIQNDGALPVTVLVTADPRTGLLDIPPAAVEVTVPAGSQATAEFDATAVSNGAVTVTVRMTSPVGVPIGQPATADVNVQAGWETPFVAAAAVAVGLLLVFGVVRTVRRIVRSRRSEGEPSDG